MKLLSFGVGDYTSIGALIGDEVLDLNAAFNTSLGGAFIDRMEPCGFNMLFFLDLGDKGIDEAEKALLKAEKVIAEGEAGDLRQEGVLRKVTDVMLLAPIPRPRKNMVCLGLNYADHVAEGARHREQQRPLPQYPIYFTKPPSAVIGPYDDIVYPRATEMLDYEVELALIIGKDGKYIEEDQVYDHIVGYTIFNDVSARDLQRQHGQWYKGKSCDTFAPMGPYLVTSDEVGDPQNLDMWLKVNGETRQNSNTENMIFDIKKIVSNLSNGITLEVGDVIATGTPSGVGSAHPLGLLNVGDVVEIWIEKIGKIENRVVGEN
jgi:2-keto-4-pentenoate hydratase/2-oxohepta-3-ene-1,7-dioic acid hydratase in catechol pathway